MKIKHSIYTNDACAYDFEDMRAELASERGCKPEELTDNQVWDFINHDIDLCYDAEQCNLDKTLSGRILVIAGLGLWNGRHSGYAIRGCNLQEVLHGGRDDDTYTVGSDGRNIIAEGIHHDGTNRYTFREIREDKNIDVLLGKLYNGTATSADISRYTKSLAPYVNEIYGWGTKSTSRIAA